MAADIDIHDETTTLTQSRLTLVRNVLQSACERLGLHAHTECSLLFVDETKIRTLNRDYRGKDQVTDVLSFALNDEEDQVISPAGHTLGDIVICVKRMRDQAEEYGHSIERELCFLALHGLLHLLGYGHESTEEEKEMFTLQEELLQAYGLARET
ncbi:rRNA maturation RNase YbeY [Natribacillus halophilus]|uniref:Endoribonuclease YbeY n=1 Tax=Natribacillus halophilus TaxID=549003 RepID=A0A1G8JS53_9BACI|nr:rRNA maturation RNase YbeY [Natribacillus halophilus]SDI34054.1 probable rRNA maturation factor [Natribacillus halophilus]